jgi:hypothetical protein
LAKIIKTVALFTQTMTQSCLNWSRTVAIPCLFFLNYF